MGIGTTVNTTLFPFMKSIDDPDLQTVVPLTTTLPLYPDVVIHYRCSDNVAIRGRGLTQFHTILNTIPSTTEYVMILNEGGDLSLLILQELRRQILAKFPLSRVIIRSGGDIFGSVAVMVNAKTLICSVSSFCLYFGALNIVGQVYMPTKAYYGHHLNMDNFHTLENNEAVTLWRNPNGTRIEIPLFHYSPSDPKYKVKFQLSARQILAVLQNETYTKVVNQYCNITNIAKRSETPLNACL